VIFLSGVNEVVPAYQYGEAGVHYDAEIIAARLTGEVDARRRESQTLGLVANFNLYRLVSRVASQARQEGDPVQFRYAGKRYASDTLARGVVQVWLANYRIVEALGREYGFDYGFFWQPNVLVGRKPLTQEEERIRAGEGKLLTRMVELVQEELASVGPPEYPSLHNLADVFAGDSSLRYLDWHHPTPEGNRIVAEAIADRLQTNRPEQQPAAARGSAPHQIEPATQRGAPPT
jgi:hypothetical protein